MIDIEVIKAWLGITTADYDEPLTELRDRLHDRIERRLDWYFGTPRPTTEILDGNGRRTLFLRQPPVDPAAVVVQYRAANGGWDTALEQRYYEVEGRKLFHLYSVWPYGKRAIRVSYQEGFTEVPGDIQQLLLDMMGANVETTAAGDKQSEKLGDYSYTIKADTTGNLEGAAGWGDVYNRWRRGRL